jgi:hypothetical protein
MKSQVSFKFDGEHNKQPVVNILKQRLKGLKYKIETETKNVYRIYVGSSQTTEEVFNICYGIQCFAILDSNRDL